MRIFVAIFIAVLLGGAAFEIAGVGLGLLVGLVVGLIWHGNAKQKKADRAAALAGTGGDPAAAAIAGAAADNRAAYGNAGMPLEQRIAALEMRIGRMEHALRTGDPAALAAFRESLVESDRRAAEYAAHPGIQPVPESAGGIPTTPVETPATSLSAAAAALHPEAGNVAGAAASSTSSGATDDGVMPNWASADDTPATVSGAPPAPPTPRQPAKPSLVQRLLSGNIVAKLGTIILFFGVSFAIKLALENHLIPVETWFAIAALFAIVLLVIGWRLRRNDTGYGLILQGGGVGILYLVTFGALKLYQLLPPSIAFLVLVALTVLSAILAILQNSIALAAIGVTGGFLAPVLASSGGGSHVGLFTYYAILNAGIVLIAWFKAWRILNVLGFVFTVSIASAWGARFYTPDLLAGTEPFLILFFVMYVGIAILFATRQAPNLKHYVDGTIVFGTPIAAFGMQAALVHDIPYAMAFSALAMGLVYVVLASVLYSRHRESLRLLVESFFALALIFGTLAIPLALDPKWTSAAWAVEGAAVMWAGIRQRRVPARVFGLLVQLLGALAFLSQVGRMGGGEWIFANSSGLGMAMIALAALFTARQMDKHADAITAPERQLTGLIFGWGCLWWLAMGINETDRHVPDRWLSAAGLAFLAASAIGFSIASTRLQWPIARWPALLLLPLYLLLALVSPGHPFAGGGWLAWPVALIVHYVLLKRHDVSRADADPIGGSGRFERMWLGAVHMGSVLLIALLGSWELHWWPAHYGMAESAWTVSAAMVIPAFLLALIARARLDRWPLTVYRDHYLVRAAAVLAIALVAWMWFANITHDGSSAPLPYLPLLNAIDLGHLLAIVAIAMWWLRLREVGLGTTTTRDSKAIRIVAGVTLFVWLNAILLRTLHHWFVIPYDLDPLWESRLVQASLSIFWTVLAFVLMLLAHKRRERLTWTIGAGLMAVVVVKLFVADLSNLSGMVRIVAFIGVGLLMVLMGYFVPLPPKSEAGAVKEAA